ncbi:MAG: hypothetical protein C0501_07170 [Isosphaera sp.]|nr:hypothetical protein [Isosphaera sp.]
MAAPPIPYPPSPADVPEGLTDLPASYVRQQNLLLAGLFVFLIFYLGAVVLFAMVGVWCALTLSDLFPLKVAGLVVCGTFFLYLVKGFFKSRPVNKDMHLEVTADEQPTLFAFIDRLCDELDAPRPDRVFVSPEVNAAVITRTSLVNLVVSPRRDLLIGLGLVNSMNLSEFKSVLAHEFGHFSQSSTGAVYTHVASRIIFDLVDGEDWFDRFLKWCKTRNGERQQVIKVFGYGVGGCLWVGRQILWWVLKSITLQRLAVMRESEFHADLHAVKAAGSDAVGLSLFRLRFGNVCLSQAVQDLGTALDHRLYTRDLFFHQDRAAAIVRRKRRDPDLGLPPAHPHPLSGKKIRVFDPDDEALADDIPEMRRTHPPAHELEESAKEQFVPAAADHRSPWVLFADAADLRERMTYKFYRMYFRVPKDTDLADPQQVQEYIDHEHAETTYDPKYQGVYDDRPVEPGDLAELNALARESPWPEDRLEKVYDKLLDGCAEHAEARAELLKELYSVRSGLVGKPSAKQQKRLADAGRRLDENWEWFRSFDRRVYLLHVQLAAAVDPGLRDELVERYRFQFEVQRLYHEARRHQERALDHARRLFASPEVDPEFVADAMQVFREARRALKKILQDAKETNLPAMKNFAEGERLADFILPGKLVPELPLSYVKGAWCQKLVDQLSGVRNRCSRLHFKSLGGILALQEKAAAAWVAARTPVAAEAFDFAAPDTADAVEAEVLDAEAVPAATSVDEVRVERLYVDDDEMAADDIEVLDADVVGAGPGFVDGPVDFRVEPIRSAREPEPAAAFAARPDGTTLPDLVPVSITPEGAAPAEEEGGGVLGAVAAAAAEVVLAAAARDDADRAGHSDIAVAALVPDPQLPATKPDLAVGPAEFDGPFGFDPTPAARVDLDLPEVDVDASTVMAAPLPPGSRPAAGRAAPEPAAEDLLEAEVIDLDAADVVEGPEPAPPPAAKPAARSGFGSGVGPGLSATTEANGGVVKPAAGRRPAVRITLVKPGEKSPFGK